MNHDVCVIGLGYVGLPLAIEFGKQYKTIGFDINNDRIEQLKNNIDITEEISKSVLKNSKVLFTSSKNVTHILLLFQRQLMILKNLILLL